jgi:DNA-binding SARP family transcriptional activator
VTIRVLTLGGLRVFRDGEEITSLPGKQLRCGLLVYLAVERSSTRDVILALLWPEKEPEKARHTLSQTLYELRQDLGNGWVESQGEVLRATEGVETDIRDFEREVEVGRLEAALGEDRRPFLEGVHLVNTREFQGWVDGIRSRMERLQRQAHRQLLEATYGAGRLLEARNRARAWALEAPLDDEAQNWLIRMLAETGQRSAALRHYEEFRSRLSRELEVEPLDETRSLVERIRRGELGALASKAGGIPSEEEPAVSPPRPQGEQVPRPEGVPTPSRTGPKPDFQPDPELLEGEVPLPERMIRRAKAHFRKLMVAGVVIFGIWEVFGPKGPRLDPYRLICFPPTMGGTIRVQTQDVCQSIQVTIEGAEPLVFQSGFSYLSQEQRQNPNSLTILDAQAIAIAQRAGHFLLPSMTAEGDSLLVTLALHETGTGDWVVSGHGAGTLSSASSGQIAARGMPSVFSAILDPGREVDLTFITDRDPGAVALWMEGERLYRNLRFDLAFERLRQAVGADSLLARAALKGALAAGWNHRDTDADSLVALALRHEGFLPRKHQQLARGLSAFYQGKADSAVSHLQAALSLDPEWNEAWIRLGEVYYHLLPTGVEVPASAIEAFRKAIELDPRYLTPLIHLAEHELRGGNTPGAERLIGRIRDANPENATLGQLEMALACVRTPLSGWEWDEHAGRDPLRTLLAGALLAAAGANLRCAEGAFRAILSVRPEASAGVSYSWGALQGLSSLLVAQARGGEAADVLRREQDAGEGSTPFLYLIQAAVSPDLDSLAQGIADIAPRIFGPDLARMDAPSGWAVATWHGARGNREELRRLTGGLNRLASGDSASVTKKWLALAAQGHLAALEGDTARAIEILSSLRPEYPSLDWGIWEVVPYERLLLAELLLADGQYPQALGAAEVFDHPGPMIFLAFLPRSLAVRVAAAEALGFADEAENFRDRLARMGRSDLLVAATGTPGLDRR